MQVVNRRKRCDTGRKRSRRLPVLVCIRLGGIGLRAGAMVRRVRWGLSAMVHRQEGGGKEEQRGSRAGYKGLLAWAERRGGRSEKEEDLREEIAAGGEGTVSWTESDQGGGKRRHVCSKYAEEEIRSSLRSNVLLP